MQWQPSYAFEKVIFHLGKFAGMIFFSGFHRLSGSYDRKQPTNVLSPLSQLIPRTERRLYFNSSPPGTAYMRQWTGSLLVQVMACRLFGAKPLPEPVLLYCQLDSWERVSVKYESELYHLLSRKCTWKCRLSKWLPFFPGWNELLSGVGSFTSLNWV